MCGHRWQAVLGMIIAICIFLLLRDGIIHQPKEIIKTIHVNDKAEEKTAVMQKIDDMCNRGSNSGVKTFTLNWDKDQGYFPIFECK